MKTRTERTIDLAQTLTLLRAFRQTRETTSHLEDLSCDGEIDEAGFIYLGDLWIADRGIEASAAEGGPGRYYTGLAESAPSDDLAGQEIDLFDFALDNEGFDGLAERLKRHGQISNIRCRGCRAISWDPDDDECPSGCGTTLGTTDFFFLRAIGPKGPQGTRGAAR